MPQQTQGHKWFAAFWERMVRIESAKERRLRDDIAGGASGRVLEIGCGVGANFPYYHDGIESLAAGDPDPYMVERARRHAADAERPIDIQQFPAEEIPFPDASFDTVVSTLNMCTIADLPRALSEVKRVLKPGGQYRFFDHVRYVNRLGALVQDAITPAWRWIGAGCNPNRDIAATMTDSGFQFDRLEKTTIVPPIPPMLFVRPQIIGVARPA